MKKPKLRRQTVNLSLDGRIYDILARLAEARSMGVREYLVHRVVNYIVDHKRDVTMPPEHYTARNDDETIEE